MNETMTSAAQMRAAKRELEEAIQKLLVDFTAKTGLQVNGVWIDTVEQVDGTMIISTVEVEAKL